MNEIRRPEHGLDNPDKQFNVQDIQAQQTKSEVRADSFRGVKLPDIDDMSEKKSKVDEPIKEAPKDSREEHLREAKIDNQPVLRDNINSDMHSSEISSKFNRENFSVENSYDARVSSEIRELATKANSELIPMGHPIPEGRSAKECYSCGEVLSLKAEREKVEVPTESTVMQKIIGVDTGDIKKDLSRYLNPTDKNNAPKSADVTGFVAKAEDIAPFSRTPQEYYENARLDYKGTEYMDSTQPVYVLRFTDGTNYEVPYNTEFGGNCKEGQPCAGNGYLASEEHMIPEFKVVKNSDDRGAIITAGEIYRLNPDGSEDFAATFDKDDRKFYLIQEV